MSQGNVAKNKQTIILECIRAGGATRASLMAAADVNKAGLASQLAYLNARGLAMAEVDPTRAEFPMTNDDGVFFMGTAEQYNAKRRAFGTAAKPKTAAEILENAQKREDRASTAYSKAEEKSKESPDDAILKKVLEIRKAEMELASMKLARVQAGDYSYENVVLATGANATTPATTEAEDAVEGKAKKKVML